MQRKLEDFIESREFMDERISVGDRIIGFLACFDGGATSAEIAEAIGALHDTVKVTLSRGNGKKWEVIMEKVELPRWKNLSWVEKNKREGSMVRGVVRLHRNGDKCAISTNAETERDFLDGLAISLAELEDDAESFRKWLPLAIDIACKIRGYKSDAIEKRVIIAGSWLPDEQEHIVGCSGGNLD